MTIHSKPTQAVIFSIISLVSIHAPAADNCPIDALTLYDTFKEYRLRLDFVDQLETLTPYFTENFNQYYLSKLKTEAQHPANNRYLNQYWDNMLTAKEVLIVLDYATHCEATRMRLTLATVLMSQFNAYRKQADVSKLTVHYQFEDNHWRIDSFEFGDKQSTGTLDLNKIVDNFLHVP